MTLTGQQDRSAASTGPAMQRQTAANLVWNYASGLLGVVGLIALFPLAVAAAGAQAYAAWVVCFGLIQLLMTADLGLGTGVVRAVAAAQVDGDAARVRRVASVGLTLFAALGVALGTALALLLPVYLDSVPLPADVRDDAGLLVALAAGSLALGLVGRGATAVLWGDNRYDIERKSAMVSLLARALALVACASTGAGLLWVALAEAVSVVAPGLVSLVVARSWHRVTLVGPSVLRAEGGALLTFSLKVFVGAFSGLLAAQLPLYVAAPSMSLVAVTAFGAWLRLYHGARMVLSWLATPFLTVAARQQLQGASLAALHGRLLGCSVALATVLAIPLLLVPSALSHAWLGDAAPLADGAVRLAAVAALALSLLLPAAVLASAAGAPLQVALLNVVWCLTAVGSMLLAPGPTTETTVAACVTWPLVVLAPVGVLRASRVTGLVLRPRRAVLVRCAEAVPVLAGAGLLLLLAVAGAAGPAGVVLGLVLYSLALTGYGAARYGRQLRRMLSARTEVAT